MNSDYPPLQPHFLTCYEVNAVVTDQSILVNKIVITISVIIILKQRYQRDHAAMHVYHHFHRCLFIT